MKRMKRGFSLILASVSLMIAITGCSDGRTDSVSTLSKEEAQSSMEALLQKVTVHEMDVNLDVEGMSENEDNLAAELPDISVYDMPVKGEGQIDVEIFASTEKSNADDENDGWILEVAEKFNKQQNQINGQTVSVSIRSIASGTALDYIISGKYTPAAFTPANELWGEMVKANDINIELVEKRIAGNTAGVLMSEKKYEELSEKYGTITLGSVVEEALEGNMLLGYTNPYVSSTGLNILTAMLQSFDENNPLSDTAIAKLEKLQGNIPSVSFTTKQLRETAAKGLLDAMVMEYQAYINTPELKDYKFIPFGVRHDNPVYALGDCTDEQKQAIKAFTDYCLSDESQKAAEKVGFNANLEYSDAEIKLTGKDLFKAQEIWKEKKDAGQPVVAVFVTDVSGSMLGTPIAELKSSLLNSTQYIGEDNYIGLISYSDDVFVNLPIGQFDNKQKAAFSGAVKSLSASGGTATYDAVLIAEQMLLEAKETIPDAKLMMFVLSDGEQQSGYSYQKVKNVIQGLKIPVHTICYGTSISEMEDLSKLNEASMIQASPEDVVYSLKNMFNSQM